MMRRTIAMAACMAAAAVFLAGCPSGESAGPEKKAAESAPAKAQTPPAGAKAKPAAKSAEKTIARVDDAVLTTSGLEAQIKLRAELLKIRKRKVGSKELDILRKKLGMTAADHFIRRELLLKCAAERGIALTGADRADYAKKFAATYKKKSIEDVKKLLSPASAELLAKDAEREALAEKTEKALRDGIDKKMDEAEIKRVYDNIATMNETAAKTNALVFARARSVYNQIKSGKLLFEEAVEDYSEAEETEDGGVWNEFLISELKDEAELIARLPTMSPGDITPPIENDNGLSIMKLVSIGEYRKGDAAPEPTYRLARVFFRLPLFMEVPTREELEKAILDKRRGEAVGKALQKAGDSSRVEGGRIERKRRAEAAKKKAGAAK